MLWEMLTPQMCIPMHKFTTDTFPDGVPSRPRSTAPTATASPTSSIIHHGPTVPMGDTIPPIEEEVHIEVYTLGDDPTKSVHRIGTAKSWRELPSLLGG
jgi:hypothetical protein